MQEIKCINADCHKKLQLSQFWLSWIISTHCLLCQPLSQARQYQLLYSNLEAILYSHLVFNVFTSKSNFEIMVFNLFNSVLLIKCKIYVVRLKYPTILSEMTIHLWNYSDVAMLIKCCFSLESRNDIWWGSRRPKLEIKCLRNSNKNGQLKDQCQVHFRPISTSS